MDPARYQRIRDLLLAASALDGAARARYLDEACAGDDALRAEVIRLLGEPTVGTGDLFALPPQDVPPPPALAGARLGGWRLRREIGVGGMGTVYEAEDERGTTRAAVKVFHPHLLASQGLRERFAREAEAGRRLEDPHVVRTIDAGEGTVGGQPVRYMVMELVAGRTLRQVLDAMGTVPEALLREIALQVSRGLHAIHAARIVHRDLKPENLIITDDERVRIMDLGVAKILEATTPLTHDGQFVGSLLYAAPEQCDGRSVGPAADLYALGVVLYELATGQNPFEREGIAATIRAHLEHRPPAAREVNPRLSPFLDQLIGALLAKRPEQRFPSAEALASTLERGEDSPWWRARQRQTAPPRRARPPRRTALHGRRAEQERLRAAWQEARGGQARVVWIEGEAGVGKSRLVDDLLEQAGEDDAEVLYASYAPSPGQGGMREALASLLGPTDLEDALRPHLRETPALVPAFAALLRGEPPPPGSAPLGPDAQATVLAQIARSLAARRPVLWVVEDLHFTDERVQALSTALARSIPGHRVLLVLTSRPGVAAAQVASVLELPHAEAIRLDRLAPDEVVALLGEALGDEAAAERVGPVLARKSDGVPLFLLAILRELETRGGLRWEHGRARVDADVVEALEVPTALEQMIAARLETLSPDERALLDTAAVQGFAFSADVLARVREVRRLQVLETLGRLERLHGLVRSEGNLFRFDHHLVQEVLYGSMALALRDELHALVAEALEAAAGAPEETPGEAAWRIAHHHLRGTDPRRARPWLSAALDHLEGSYANEAAIQMGERALEVDGLLEEEASVELRMRLPRRMNLIGRYAEARAMAESAVALADRIRDPRLQTRARVTLCYQLLAVGDWDTCLQVAREAEGFSGAVDDASSLAEAVGAQGQVMWCTGRYDEAERLHRRCREIALAAGDERRHVLAGSNLAIVLQERGELADAETLLRETVEVTQRLGDWPSMITGMTNLGNVLHGLGRKAEALKLYETVVAEERRRAYRSAETVAWVNIGLVRVTLGDLAGGRRALERCLALCRETGNPRVEGYAIHGLALVAGWEGRTEEAEAHFGEALRLRRRIGNPATVADSLLRLGVLRATTGRPDDAVEVLEEAAELGRESGQAIVIVPARLWLAVLRGGDLEAALALVREHEARLWSDSRMEAYYLLWRLGGNEEHLAEAWRTLASQRDQAPPGLRSAMLEGIPLHRDIVAAWRSSTRDEG